jgi:hypothetical protein
VEARDAALLVAACVPGCQQDRGSGAPRNFLVLRGLRDIADVPAAFTFGIGNERRGSTLCKHVSLLNDLAPPELRGRYKAIDALIVSTGSIVGPLLVVAVYTRRGTGDDATATGACWRMRRRRAHLPCPAT